MSETTTKRWESLDILRGLSIIGMLINLTPGAWDHQYSWIQHAKWQGGHLIDMVAPVFLFCIGAAIPLSLANRSQKGENNTQLTFHIVWRALALVAIGLFLNAYPAFDLPHLRIPGVLQKIGLAFALAAIIVLWTAKRDGAGLTFSWRMIAGAAVAILLAHWALLYFVPVPGFGAPRFDPIGSWPAFIDRTLFTVPHMFIWWPVDGKVVFDPDGLLNVAGSAVNILLGTLTALAWQKLKRPVLTAFLSGFALMVVAVALNAICPIIKNIWTSTFVLFSTGFALVLLSLLTVLVDSFKAGPALFPLKVYGANPLLAYLICFLFAPLLDLLWIPLAPHGTVSLKSAGQIMFTQVFDPDLASFLVSVTYLCVVFLVLWLCYRKRWFLKL